MDDLKNTPKKAEQQPSRLGAVICRFFLRQFYKIPQYESRGDDAMYGKFRVKYNDGKISQKMCYRNARDYAKMFGGIVLDAF
jgi:hypothetical protein